MFKMMECRGDRKTSATRSTNTDSVHSARPCNEGRAAALRYVAKTLLNEREREGEEEEDLCSDFLSSFINTLEDRQWESIRERMRQPLTQTHLARVSRRIIRVVSELVFQLLVPALMDRLQAEDDFPVASRGSSKSCKLHGSHSEEETQSTDSRPTSHSDTPLNRSSPVMVRPFIEDPVQKSSGVNEESLAKSLGRSISQSSARSMPGKVEQQVNQSPTGLGACTPPLESHAEVCADQAQEQVAEVTSVTGKALSFVDGGFAEVESWQDVKQFLVPATEEVISAIIKSMDVCQEKIEAGAETEKTATKILKHLAIKMRSSEFTEEETQNRYLDQFDLESLEDFEKDFFCNFTHLHEKLQCSISKVRTAFKNRERDGKTLETNPEVREGSPLQGMMITYPMTVCSQDVVKDLSCRRFRHTSLKELKEFLMRSVQTFFSQNFGAMAPSLELCMASVDSVASEMLDVVVNSVNQLCQPQPTESTLPWQQSENTTVSEEQVASTATVLKLHLQEKLQDFFNFQKEASEKLKEGEIEKEMTVLSNMSDIADEDTQRGGVMHSSHKAATGSRESVVKSMTDVVRSFLDETEQSLKQQGSVQGGDGSLSGLEELIRQDQLSNFSKVLTDKITTLFYQKEQSRRDSLKASRLTSSASELGEQARCPSGLIQPCEEVYVFVEETVKRLLTSVVFPPPSWGMGHMIQVQSDPSSAANWEKSVEEYEGAIGVYSQLISDKVKGRVSRMSASSRLQQEAGGQLSVDAQGKDTQGNQDEVLDGVTKPKENNICGFFHNIRKKWRALTGSSAVN